MAQSRGIDAATRPGAACPRRRNAIEPTGARAWIVQGAGRALPANAWFEYFHCDACQTSWLFSRRDPAALPIVIATPKKDRPPAASKADNSGAPLNSPRCICARHSTAPWHVRLERRSVRVRGPFDARSTPFTKSQPGAGLHSRSNCPSRDGSKCRPSRCTCARATASPASGRPGTHHPSGCIPGVHTGAPESSAATSLASNTRRESGWPLYPAPQNRHPSRSRSPATQGPPTKRDRIAGRRGRQKTWTRYQRC